MRMLLIITALFLSSNALDAQGIEFFHGQFEEALEQAGEEGKIVFVDAYAVWCGPCKRMSKYVFTDESVGAFYNEHFINVKMDMERGQGLEFKKDYPVNAYPTLYYIDPDGKVVLATKGARQSEAFIELGRKALNEYNPVEKYETKYEEGNREFDLVYNYVKALNRSGASSLKVANEYLDAQEDLGTENNLKFILEATTEADSRIFKLLVKHRDAIQSVTSEQAVQSRIKYACSNTAEKAIEFEAPSLIEEAVQKMEEYHPEEAEFFEYTAWLEYTEAVGSTEDYFERVEDFMKKYDRNRPNEVINLCEHVLDSYSDSDKALEIAAHGAKKAARKADNHEFHFIHARILYKLGAKEDALDALDEAIELAEDQGDEQNIANYKMFRKGLSSKS